MRFWRWYDRSFIALLFVIMAPLIVVLVGFTRLNAAWVAMWTIIALLALLVLWMVAGEMGRVGDQRELSGLHALRTEDHEPPSNCRVLLYGKRNPRRSPR